MAKQTKGGLQRFAEGNRVKKGKGMAALNVLGRIGSDADAAMASRRVGNTQFGDVGPSTQGIIKDVGGNWVPSAGGVYKSELERQLGRMQRGINDMPTDHLVELIEKAKSRGNETLAASLERDLQSAIKRDAGNKFIQSNLKNYITKEMATEKDPVRKLAEQGITAFPKTEDEYGDIMLRNYGSATTKQRREATGFPEKGVAKSKLAKHYETLSDEAISPRKAKRYQDIQKLPYMQRPRGAPDMPFVSKLDPESQMYQLSDEADFEKLGFNHIMDVLREDMAAGRIRPEQLSKMSMEQAVRRTHQYDEDLARNMLIARQKEMGEANVFKEYPDDGYKWVQLDKPGQFSLESDTMGHSVRGYEPPKGHPDWVEGSGDSGSDTYGHGGWEAIKSGKAKIYSLRDPKGLSHTTVEVGPQNFFDFNKWWEKQPKELKDEINARARRGEHSGSIYEAPEYIAAKEAVLPMVSQIKGKQNAAPNEQYLPYIQDFVKSGDFSEVREIQNAGLMDAQRTLNPTTYAKYIENKLEVPKYATEAELEKIHNEYLKLAEPSNAKPDFAKGGNVSHSHHYYQIARDFDLPHLSEGGEVLEGEGHERHGLIQDLYATIADMKAKNKPKDEPKKFDKGGYAFQDPMGAPDSALTPNQQEYTQAFKDAARDAYYNDKRNLVTPKGKKQFAQQALATYAGQPVDIANMLAGGLDATVGRAMGAAFPSLTKPAEYESVLGKDRPPSPPRRVVDPSGERVLAYPLSSDKPRRGSADLVERLGHDYEFYSAPVAAVGVDLATGMAMPAAKIAKNGARLFPIGSPRSLTKPAR
jgi:hypothetical protein